MNMNECIEECGYVQIGGEGSDSYYYYVYYYSDD